MAHGLPPFAADRCRQPDCSPDSLLCQYIKHATDPAGPLTHARQPVALLNLAKIKAPAVVTHLELQLPVLDEELNLCTRAAGMTNRVVDALFENQKHFAAQVGPEPHF